MEKLVDSMVIVARGASRNVRMFPLTVLFTFTMVIIINCILGLTKITLLLDIIIDNTIGEGGKALPLYGEYRISSNSSWGFYFQIDFFRSGFYNYETRLLIEARLILGTCIMNLGG